MQKKNLDEILLWSLMAIGALGGIGKFACNDKTVARNSSQHPKIREMETIKTQNLPMQKSYYHPYQDMLGNRIRLSHGSILGISEADVPADFDVYKYGLELALPSFQTENPNLRELMSFYTLISLDAVVDSVERIKENGGLQGTFIVPNSKLKFEFFKLDGYYAITLIENGEKSIPYVSFHSYAGSAGGNGINERSYHFEVYPHDNSDSNNIEGYGFSMLQNENRLNQNVKHSVEDIIKSTIFRNELPYWIMLNRLNQIELGLK